MTATISGDGTSTLINLTTSGNTILGDASTDTLNVGNGGLVKDASGNIGIGTASPGATLDLRGTYRQIQATDAQALNSLTQLTLQRNGNDSRLAFGYTTGNSAWNITASYGSTGAYAPIAFATSDTERMRIDSSGNLLVGTTTAADNSGIGVKIFPSYSGSGAPEVACVSSTSSTSYGSWYMYSTADSQYKFYVNYAGTVFARSTSITGLSDISEKENIKPLETGLSEILALQPRRFDWKAGDKKNVAGFVAQEVQSVLPDLIEEYKSSNTETKLGLKMGDMIPTLVKAIQEQQALITSLTDRITALEAKP